MCVISCRLACDITLHMFYLSQGLPGPDGPAGEKGESVSAAKLFLLISEVLNEAFLLSQALLIVCFIKQT